MNLFDNNTFKDDELFKGGDSGSTHLEPIPEGAYTGKIADTEAVKSQAGHNGVKIEIALNNGRKIFDRLNVEHPTVGEFARKALARIIKGAYKNPESIKVTNTTDAAKLLKGLPVNITVKQRGANDKGYMQYNIYYNQVATKLVYAATASGTTY